MDFRNIAGFLEEWYQDKKHFDLYEEDIKRAQAIIKNSEKEIKLINNLIAME